MPLPAGLPVRIRSPGSNRAVWEIYETNRATPKIMSLVDSSCMVSPLSFRVTCRSEGSAMESAGTIHGPSGVKPGAFLLRSQSVPIGGMSRRKTLARSVRSLAMV